MHWTQKSPAFRRGCSLRKAQSVEVVLAKTSVPPKNAGRKYHMVVMGYGFTVETAPLEHTQGVPLVLYKSRFFDGLRYVQNGRCRNEERVTVSSEAPR